MAPQIRARLHKQIARCNSSVSKDKYNHYRSIVSENAHDSMKLWQVLCAVLYSVPETIIPSHDSQKSLANHFMTFFSDEITKIWDSFFSSDSFTLPAHSDLP